jgi:prepilin-type processing-associated H-X9-DG protein
LLVPQFANAQGKAMQCLVFGSATVRSSGDSGAASATISKAGYVLTGGGCQVAMADGSVPSPSPPMPSAAASDRPSFKFLFLKCYQAFKVKT